MKLNLTRLFFVSLLTFLLTPVLRAAEGDRGWKPGAGPLLTRWAKDVSPDHALPEYPRPQLVRKDWQNLNGLWEYAIRPKDEPRPAFDVLRPILSLPRDLRTRPDSVPGDVPYLSPEAGDVES